MSFESQSREGRSFQEGQAPRRVAGEGGLGSSRNTLIFIIPILVVLITFLFWYQTWFGRPLSEREMSQYLSDTSVPHNTQHALAQLSDRMARGDGMARRWYPEIIALAQNKEPQLRDMLLPFTLAAPQAGTLKFCLKEQDAVQSGGIVARISSVGGANSVDVVSPMAGKVARLAVKEGGQIGARVAIAVIGPGEAQVFEALRALALIGQPETLADVERFAASVPGMSERVRQQALLTAQAIRQKVRQKREAE